MAHILHEGSLDGSVSPNGITAAQMTDTVWSYIMLEGPAPGPGCGIAPALLERMRNEFQYFYPLDLRCSGKDLINNHLTFFLYNHTAIFPRERWPMRSVPTGTCCSTATR